MRFDKMHVLSPAGIQRIKSGWKLPASKKPTPFPLRLRRRNSSIPIDSIFCLPPHTSLSGRLQLVFAFAQSNWQNCDIPASLYVEQGLKEVFVEIAGFQVTNCNKIRLLLIISCLRFFICRISV